MGADVIRLLRKDTKIATAIWYSYFVEVASQFSEFPLLLQYSPSVIGDFLKKAAEANPDFYTGGLSKCRPSRVPSEIMSRKVLDDACMFELDLVSNRDNRVKDSVFGTLRYGCNRVSLTLNQLGGDEYVYSFDFHAWNEENEEWVWNAVEAWTEDRNWKYTTYMWQRFSALLLGLSGVACNAAIFYTDSSRKLSYVSRRNGIPTASGLSELFYILEDKA